MKQNPRIFVDGQEGTTGLQIRQRLENHPHVEIMTINPEKRRDTELRRQYLNEADIVFLCLPDEAARESVNMIENSKVRVLDASTAHRTNPDWAYGLPEYTPFQREKIKQSKRVAVPGCHASAFILAMNPLVKGHILPTGYPVFFYSLTGYSGAGKKMIAIYEAEDRKPNDSLSAPRPYALNFQHKHLPETKYYSGLDRAPFFSPIIGDFYKGLSIALPLDPRFCSPGTTVNKVHSLLAEYYQNEPFIKVLEPGAESCPDGFLDPQGCNDTNMCEIFVFGNDQQVMVMSRLDNLGKGASGAAVQCMNIMLGIDESTTLV